MPNIATFTVQIAADLGRFLRGFQIAQARIDTFTRQGITAAQGLRTASIVIAGAGAALAAALTLGVKTAADFEKEMRNVNSIAKVSEDEFKKMSSAVLDLSRQLPIFPDVAAKGLYSIVSAGFQANAALEVLTASTKAAAAGLSSVDVASRAIVATMNAYGSAAGSAAEVSDVLFRAVDKGVLTFEELATQWGEIVGIGASMGVSIQDLAAAFATLTITLPAPEAATSLVQALRSLVDPSKELRQVYSEMGIVSVTSAIAQEGLFAVLQKILRASGGTIESMRALFNEWRAQRGIVGLLIQDMSEYDRIQQALRDSVGATDKAIAEQSKAFLFQLQRLQSNMMVLRVTIGNTLIPTLNSLLDRLLAVTAALDAFSRAHPTLTKAVVGASGALGVLLIVISGFLLTLAAFISLLFRMPSIMFALGIVSEGASRSLKLFAREISLLAAAIVRGGLDRLVKGIIAVFTNLPAVLARVTGLVVRILSGLAGAVITFFRALWIAARANPVMAIVTLLLFAIPVIVRNWDIIKATFASGVVFVTEIVLGLWRTLAAFFDWLKDPTSANFSKVIDNWNNIWANASKKASEAYQKVIGSAREAREAAQKATQRPPDDLRRSVEQVKDAFEALTTEIDIFEARAKSALVSVARSALQTPGLSREAVAAQIEHLADEEIRVEEEALERRVAIARQFLTEVRNARDTNSKEIRQAEEKLAKAEEDLERKRLERVQTVAERVANIEADLRDRRADLLLSISRLQEEAARQALDVEKEVSQDRLNLEKDLIQRRMDLYSLEEEFRVGVIKRLLDLERDLGNQIVSLRQGLIGLTFAREMADLEKRNAAREQLVKRGFLSEREATRRAAEEALAIEQRRLQDEVDLAEEQLRQANRRATLERQFLVVEAQSKIAILAAETQVRRKQLDLDRQLRIADLRASIGIMEAETAAKRQELEIQYNLRRDALIRELQAREAAGQLTPRERAARVEAIRLLDLETKKSADQQAELLRQRQQATKDRLVLVERGYQDTIAAIEAEAAVRRQAIEQELAVNIVRLANASAQERVKIAERLAGLLTDATRKQIETEAALRRQEVTEAGRDGRIGGGIRRRGLSEEEIRRRTRGFEGIQDQIRSVLVATEADTESQLQSIERAYRSFADRIVGILKPVTDMIKLITDPQTALNALIPRNLVPAPAAVPTPAAAPTVNYFTFQGTTFRLTADETAIIRRVLEAIMGSEGARYFDDHMKRRPGGR